MWILVLEALVALSMLVLVVWLTTGGKRPRDAATTDEKPEAKSNDRE
jgi:hypothetical protein